MDDLILIEALLSMRQQYDLWLRMTLATPEGRREAHAKIERINRELKRIDEGVRARG